MLRTHSLIILVFLTGSLFGQSSFKKNDIHRLKDELRRSTDAKSRIQAKILIGTYYLKRRHAQNTKDIDSAVYYFNNALSSTAGINTNDIENLRIEAFCILGEASFARSHLNKGMKLFDKAIAYAEKRGNQHLKALLMARLVKKLCIYTYDRAGAKPYVDEARNIFNSEKDFNSAAEMAFFDAYININDSNREFRKNLCKTCIADYKNFGSPWVGKCYYLLAVFHRYDGKLSLALRYALEGISWMERTKDTVRQDFYYGELGQIYQELGETEKSVQAYRKTIAIRDTMYIKQEYLIRTIGFICQGLIKQNKPKEALREILNYEKRHKPDADHEASLIYQVKAACYNALGEYELAEKYYLKAIDLTVMVQNEVYMTTKYDVGKFYVERGKYDKAALYLKNMIYPGMIISQKRDLFYLYHKIDSATGNFASSLRNYKNYKELNDSLFNTAKIHEVQNLQIQYETSKKERDIQLLKQQQFIQGNSLKRAELIRNLTLICIFLLGIIVLVLFRSYRKSASANSEIKQKNKELNSLVNEKQWLVKEIHHRVKNNLQIITGLLHRQSRFIKNKDALSILKDSEHRMQSIALIHQKLYQNENMVFIDIHTYINDLVANLKESYALGSRLDFKMNLAPVRLNVSQAVPLGLILNEAITNAIKYAYPATLGTIFISLSNEGGNSTLIVRDNGLGVPENWELSTANSMGMNLMQGLSKQLCGNLSVYNDSGVSVKLTFTI